MNQGFITKKINAFEEYLRKEERSAATIEKYMRDLRVFWSYVKNLPINKQTVVDYKNKLGEEYAVSSANSMIAAVNSFLKFCGLAELCVKQFKLQRDAYRAEERELTREEYLRLLRAASDKKNQRLALMLQTICGTGIRVSELQYVTVEAVRRGETAVYCKGKNRHIFIIDALKKKLLRYAKEQGISSGAIFLTKNGRTISRYTVWKEMKSLCKEAGVSPKKVFPHNLRHLFARAFYSIDRDIAKLADILGHSSINTTRIYIATTCVEHIRKMEKLRLII